MVVCVREVRSVGVAMVDGEMRTARRDNDNNTHPGAAGRWGGWVRLRETRDDAGMFELFGLARRGRQRKTTDFEGNEVRGLLDSLMPFFLARIPCVLGQVAPR